MALNTARIEQLVHELLLEIGEDPAREGLVKTPQRVAKAMEFLTSFITVGVHGTCSSVLRAVLVHRSSSVQALY